MARLGVNIDHVATIRQARKTVEPDPVWAAVQAELAGADGITVHLREDRRHIQDRDVRLLKETVRCKLNLEMAVSDEIIEIALDLHPDQVTLVPEKREEVTTEGGLDIIRHRKKVEDCVNRLYDAGIEVSLFIDPDEKQINAGSEMNIHGVELHTGKYADAESLEERAEEFVSLEQAGIIAHDHDLALHMGHGLTYLNVGPIAEIEGVSELNIGHSIVSRAVLVGMQEAVREMKNLIS